MARTIYLHIAGIGEVAAEKTSLDPYECIHGAGYRMMWVTRKFDKIIILESEKKSIGMSIL